jgi:hypothetical protein
VEQVSSEGFCAFVRKPVDPRALLDAVNRWIEYTAAGATWVELAGYGDRGTVI